MEVIVLEEVALQSPAQFDLAIMAFSPGTERTRLQWHTLLESAGLMGGGVSGSGR